MQSMIRFSIFGNYERFSTNNLDVYMKLIEFFGRKGYKPSTANELQLQPDGQSRVLIMPVFLHDMEANVEITSSRINFQKNIYSTVGVNELKDKFIDEFSELIVEFVKELSIEAKRVALNCDILKEEITNNMPTQSSYYDDANKTEMSVRNVARNIIEGEESNIIIEKYVTTQGNFTKYSYDINSIAENQAIRFDFNNIMSMYKAYIDIAIEIEKGLK